VTTYETARTGASLRARQLRRDSTEAEKRLLRALRSKLPPYKWRHQMPIGPYFADFACFSEKLVVELDGGQHADAAEYDAARTRFIESNGYRVLRFWNSDVLSNSDGVLEEISLSLGRGKEQRQLREGEVDSAQSSSPSHALKRAGPSLSQGRGEVGVRQ
jgi:very-short-patch-repair endonuclease